MSIDWIHFIPLSAALGGAMIGLAAVCLMVFLGRIAGISGILGGYLRDGTIDIGWRTAFLGGLIVAPVVYAKFAPLPEVTVDASSGILIAAGLLVGLGTRYGSGCTSGHGVCGLSRLSLRSAVAVAAFMSTGFITVFIMRHIVQG
jgi:uncharacterized membrane protein YedE/YeeE